MAGIRQLLGLGKEVVKEAKHLDETAEAAKAAAPPLRPEDVADYLKTVKETGQTHRAESASIQPSSPPPPPPLTMAGNGSTGMPPEKAGISKWKTGLAGAALAVGGVIAGISAASSEGVGFFGKYFGAKTDKILTDTQIGAQQANNLADLQRSGGIRQAGLVPQKVQESELQHIVKDNLKDYIAFANSAELDPKNIAPNITTQQTTALMRAFVDAQQKARLETNEYKKGLAGHAVSLIMGKDDTPVTIDSSNLALFIDNFRKTTENELKQLDVSPTTKNHLMVSLFDPTQEDSVVSKLSRRLEPTR